MSAAETVPPTDGLPAIQQVSELLGVPADEGWIMAGCVTLGYPTGRWGVAPRRPVEEVAHRNRWGAPLGFSVDGPLWPPAAT